MANHIAARVVYITPPCQAFAKRPRRIMRDIAAAVWLMVAAVWIAALVPQAIVREADWRQDRLCQYYAIEANIHAIANGKEQPC